MKLHINGQINEYYVQMLCMIFFPGEKFSDKEGDEGPELFLDLCEREGELIATVKLSDKGHDGDQAWKGETYRYAEILDAKGNTVLTTKGHTAFVAAEGNCAVFERANSFKIDYIELYQFGYRYDGDKIIPND